MENKKKSVGATNEKVSKYDDIAFSILSKLPLKSLKRFGCVRKSWSPLFENTHFMNMFRNDFLSNSHRYHHGASLILRDYEDDQNILYSFSGPMFENKIKLDCPNRIEEVYDFDIFGLGGSDGTLCLHDKIECKIIFWNPTTNQFNLIPPSPVESYLPDAAKVFCSVVSCLHGFGYNHGTCDYKIIRRLFFQGLHREHWPYVPSEDVFGDAPLVPLWEIYSLRSNSWKKLDFDMPGYMQCGEGIQVYMDGFCHWLCKDNRPIGPCLVSFDLSNEVFFTTPIPSDVDDCFKVGVRWRNLVVLNGSIALISYRDKITTCDISILGELNVKESWTKLFTIRLLSCTWCPVGMGTKGEIFFLTKDMELAWFDLSTQTIEELGYKVESCDCRIMIYNKSIVPIGGISS